MSTPATSLLRIDAEELAGDLPLVCARTGRHDALATPVWFARSPSWAWLPLALLLLAAMATTSWAPLASWWMVGAVVLPILTSRGVTGRVPLSPTVHDRIIALRRRRLGVILAALLLTWVAVGLWLIGSRAGGMLVMALVVGLYLMVVGMFWTGRHIGVRGWPEDDGGATLRDVHPAFVDAVQLRSTGHRP